MSKRAKEAEEHHDECAALENMHRVELAKAAMLYGNERIIFSTLAKAAVEYSDARRNLDAAKAGLIAALDHDNAEFRRVQAETMATIAEMIVGGGQ